jgi:hypothetical protein
MYLINKEKNNIEKIEEVTFKSVGFKERQHLQEWIAKIPCPLCCRAFFIFYSSIVCYTCIYYDANRIAKCL